MTGMRDTLNSSKCIHGTTLGSYCHECTTPAEQDAYYQQNQLDRIEADLKEIKALLAKKKRVVKPKGSKSDLFYDSKFLAIWDDYPKGHGGNKRKAYAAYQKRLSETKRPLELAVNIHIAVIKYAEFIKATGQSIKHPATFFGPDRHYLNDYTIPASAKREALPRNDEDLEAFAVGHKLHSWGNAPEHVRNMRQYREWIKERM